MHQKHSTWKSPALVVLTTHQQSWRAACTKQSQQLTNTWCRHNSQASNNTTLYVSLTRWESNFAQTFNMSTCSLFSFVRMSKDTQRERERESARAGVTTKWLVQQCFIHCLWCFQNQTSVQTKSTDVWEAIVTQSASVWPESSRWERTGF